MVGPEQTLREVVDSLQAAGVEYMVTGSVASAYHGAPRATQDIDMVVKGTLDQFLLFAREVVGREFYVSEDAIHGAVQRRSQFNVIDQKSQWKIDLIISGETEFPPRRFRIASCSRVNVSSLFGAA